MMNFNELIVVIVTGVVSSLIGSWITSARAKYKEKKIRRQLEELDYEDKFLEKISKGNVELLRVHPRYRLRKRLAYYILSEYPTLHEQAGLSALSATVERSHKQLSCSQSLFCQLIIPML